VVYTIHVGHTAHTWLFEDQFLLVRETEIKIYSVYYLHLKTKYFSSFEKFLWSTIFKLIQSQNGRIMLNLVIL